jgi:glutaminyl-tRNA synthetase
MSSDMRPAPSNFIRNIVIRDLESGKHSSVVTRFPPEPNGFLHIGHTKAICLNFDMANEFSGTTNLRFDDTNPLKEKEDYAEAIMNDIRWLGYEWDKLRHASDYFDQFYEFAKHLVETGKAYVDSLSAEEIRIQRGTLEEPGVDSPFRDRPVEESLELFEKMKAGDFEDGAHVLRAKIDMAAGNINMRDPLLYRIRKVTHHRTGDTWSIYPLYDFAHCISDAIEGITHSLCTLEFEDHRPLYDWILECIPSPSHPQQIEFARLNLDYTVLSKRKLNELVETGLVSGWDDPRMPTVAGFRRRGYTPASIRNFCVEIGVTKSNSIIPMGVLENSVRNDLNENSPRAMAVLDPLKVVLTNYPEGDSELLEGARHPQKPEMGTRKIPLGRELYIERGDFMEEAPKKFFRLKPGGEVRLRNAFIIRCDDVIKDAAGNVTELHCSFDPATRTGMPESNRKVKGTIHWVSANQGVRAEVRLYDRLFNVSNPLADKTRDFKEFINPNCLDVVEGIVESSVFTADFTGAFQFERVGYFTEDSIDSTPEKPVFNRVVAMRDSWARFEKENAAA